MSNSFLSISSQKLCFLSLVFLCLFKCSAIFAQQDSGVIAPLIVIPDSSIVSTDSSSSKKEEKKRPKGISKNHSPRTAVILSLTLPGAGQIYNRRYWKLPIVYGGLGGLTYLAIYNGQKYQCYRKSYLAMVDTVAATVNTCDPDLTAGEMKLQRDSYQKNYEYSLVGLLGFYLLTAADAFVDAHLMNFDISDDLSMSLRPSLQFNSFSATPFRQGSWSAGLGVNFRFSQKAPTLNKSFF